MELPITVMIVLFVTIIVGVAILSFAKGTLFDAKENIKELIPDKDKDNLDDRIIEITTLTESGVRSLAESCINDAILEGELDRRTCVVIRAETIDLPSTIGNITIKGRTYTFNDQIGDGTTVFMTYDSSGIIELKT